MTTRRALTWTAGAILAAFVCVAPIDASALADTAEVAAAAAIGDDGATEGDGLQTLAAIEGTIIGTLMALISGAFMLWIRSDRKRTDDTMKADRTRAEHRTDQLVSTLREQNDLMRSSHDATLATMRAADEANRQGLADLARSVGTSVDRLREDMDRGFTRLDDDVRVLGGRVAALETNPAASTARGRRATKDT